MNQDNPQSIDLLYFLGIAAVVIGLYNSHLNQQQLNKLNMINEEQKRSQK